MTRDALAALRNGSPPGGAACRPCTRPAGGWQGIHRLEDIFYASVLADPVLLPLCGQGQVKHVERLTWFTAESFGGPGRVT